MTETKQNPIQIARQCLLAPTGLDDGHLDRALNTLLRGGVDHADLYFQVSRHETWSLEDGIVKEGSHSIEQGVGVHADSEPLLIDAGSARVKQRVDGVIIEWFRAGGRGRSGDRLWRSAEPLQGICPGRWPLGAVDDPPLEPGQAHLR